MLRKNELEHGNYYKGHCRNASIARWNGINEEFIYIRQKFGDTFLETINHPEDDNGFDLFIPIRKCSTSEIEEIEYEIRLK